MIAAVKVYVEWTPDGLIPPVTWLKNSVDWEHKHYLYFCVNFFSVLVNLHLNEDLFETGNCTVNKVDYGLQPFFIYSAWLSPFHKNRRLSNTLLCIFFYFFLNVLPLINVFQFSF